MMWLFTQQDFSIVGRTFGFKQVWSNIMCIWFKCRVIMVTLCKSGIWPETFRRATLLVVKLALLVGYSYIVAYESCLEAYNKVPIFIVLICVGGGGFRRKGRITLLLVPDYRAIFGGFSIVADAERMRKE